jgi:hypothetical protein
LVIGLCSKITWRNFSASGFFNVRGKADNIQLRSHIDISTGFTIERYALTIFVINDNGNTSFGFNDA